VKPVPPILLINGKDDTTVTYDRFTKSGKKMYAPLDPAPKANAVLLDAGVYTWGHTDEVLPHGIAPAFLKHCNEAIREAYLDP
jgi:hypothetical protein